MQQRRGARSYALEALRNTHIVPVPTTRCEEDLSELYKHDKVDSRTVTPASPVPVYCKEKFLPSNVREQQDAIQRAGATRRMDESIQASGPPWRQTPPRRAPGAMHTRGAEDFEKELEKGKHVVHRTNIECVLKESNKRTIPPLSARRLRSTHTTLPLTP